MNGRLQIILFLTVCCLFTTVHSLRGALFRSGRSYRYLQLPQVESQENVDKRSNIILSPYGNNGAQHPLMRNYFYDLLNNPRNNK
ncbi:unnamed protein product [Auanema sp. JU1783]|nr:unnamed protein product [Auanema sp. JU1783]